MTDDQIVTPPDNTFRIPLDSEESEGQMALEKRIASEQFDSVMEYSFAEMVKTTRHASQRLSDHNDFISTRSQTAHLEEGIKVGTREAAAMQRMDDNKLAANVLAHRAVSDQPPLTRT